MAKDFIIPNLGEGIEEATIVRWLVEDGAKVNAGDEIIELETDKAAIPVPTDAAGYLHIGPYKADDVVSVGTVVATIGQQYEAYSPGGDQNESDSTPEEPIAVEQKATPDEETVSSNSGASPEVGPTDGKPRATPVAEKMAADLGLELKRLTGTGEYGKITKADIQRATDSGQEAPEPASKAELRPSAEVKAKPTTPAPAPLESPAPSAEDVLETIPVKGIRGVIARRMAESVQTTAHVTLVTEVDATELVALREQLKTKYAEAWGFAPGYNDLLALIVASALHQFPYMNARLAQDGAVIEQLKSINLGMAVDTERGLLVTVIREADKKGLKEFGAEFREMVDRARVGKSYLEDLSGGTFTITNLGMYRVDAFTPIINLPEAAILGVGRIAAKPVARGEEVVVRKMMTLSLVFDHRLTDGAPAARFLDYICEVIEEPSLLFLTKR
jgi:pyruvate dehydrogenase E2 component (dihydrolipoamide acetyltransferase)